MRGGNLYGWRPAPSAGETVRSAQHAGHAGDDHQSPHHRCGTPRRGSGQAHERKIVFESDKPLTGQEFDEFIKLKEHNGSYNINNIVNFDPNITGRQKVTANLDIPSFISAGNYEIFLYCFKNGNLIQKASSSFLIEEVGLTVLIKKLAFGKPAIYGIFAIIIALGAGFIIGITFSKRNRGGH